MTTTPAPQAPDTPVAPEQHADMILALIGSGYIDWSSKRDANDEPFSSDAHERAHLIGLIREVAAPLPAAPAPTEITAEHRATIHAKVLARGDEDHLICPPLPAEQAGELPPVILKGIGKINGDGWKDTTKVGDVVFVWNKERPKPYSAGQFPRIGNQCGWTASTGQYDFAPATAEEASAAIEAMLAASPAVAQPAAQGAVRDDFARGYFCAVSVLLRETGTAGTHVKSLFSQGGNGNLADQCDIELFREHGLIRTTPAEQSTDKPAEK